MTAVPDEMPSERPTLRIRRVFDAPRALVWSAWTRPELIVRWLGPVEWPAVQVTSDFRVGGLWAAVLRAPDARTLRQHGVYREIVPLERLVFTFKWEDGHEDGTPVETLVAVALSDRPGARTELDFTHSGLKSDRSLVGHRYGWNSSFGRFDEWIAANSVDHVQ